jgi:hypothetical protein
VPLHGDTDLVSKTIRFDPMTGHRARPGRGYWRHKGLSPKGDEVLPNGKLTDARPPGSKRFIKTMTRRLSRRRFRLEDEC